MFGHGSGNYISRALGAQENDNARRMSATGFFSALIGGLVIALAGIAFLRPLVMGLGSTRNHRALCRRLRALHPHRFALAGREPGAQ